LFLHRGVIRNKEPSAHACSYMVASGKRGTIRNLLTYPSIFLELLGSDRPRGLDPPPPSHTHHYWAAPREWSHGGTRVRERRGALRSESKQALGLGSNKPPLPACLHPSQALSGQQDHQGGVQRAAVRRGDAALAHPGPLVEAGRLRKEGGSGGEATTPWWTSHSGSGLPRRWDGRQPDQIY